MSIKYKGLDVPIFTIPPNWRHHVRSREIYGDYVREMLDTSEDRLSLQPRARWGLRYMTMTLSAQETGYIRKVLEQAADMPCGVGLWTEAVKLNVAAVAGNPFLETESTANLLFEIGGYLMVWTAFNNFETVKILDISPSGFTLATALTKSWAVGDWVVPILLGKLQKPPASALTDENGIFRVEFEEQFLAEVNRLCAVIAGTDAYQQLAMEQECNGGPDL